LFLSICLLILDFLDNLVFDLVLAVLSITPTVGIGLGIAGFLTCVLNCGSVGAALLLDLLALIHGLIPFLSFLEPRL
jgi:hypothetical protein